MKVLIIEDEIPAAEKLERLLLKYDPTIEIVGKMDSIRKSVAWLSNPINQAELLFMDIHLTDGQSFDIFHKLTLDTPVIFTTAHHEYALDAFQHNSIAYLLKPITYDALAEGMDKIKKLRESLPGERPEDHLQEIKSALSLLRKNYKTRFMVKLGAHIRSVPTDRIAFFFAEGRTVTLVTLKQGKFIVDYKLEELEEILDPNYFFRLNRSFVIHIQAIKDVLIHSNSRLRIVTEVETEKEIIVSREKVAAFKEWFDDRL